MPYDDSPNINNANGCISVHALNDQGQDVCLGAFVCLYAHMYVNVCVR